MKASLDEVNVSIYIYICIYICPSDYYAIFALGTTVYVSNKNARTGNIN